MKVKSVGLRRQVRAPNLGRPNGLPVRDRLAGGIGPVVTFARPTLVVKLEVPGHLLRIWDERKFTDTI